MLEPVNRLTVNNPTTNTGRRTSNYFNSAVWTHHSSSTEVSLASCSSEGGVEARVPSPPVVSWTNTVVPNFRHSAYYQHWPSSASTRVWEDMCRSTHTQQLQRQKFFSCQSSCVESLAIISVAGHELQPLQACTERTCLGYSRPWRAVTNLLSCAIEVYLLTYIIAQGL